jgi:uncharacterized membrane protein
MLPTLYLAAVLLFLIYGITLDSSVGYFFGTGAAIAVSVPFIVALLIGLYFISSVDVAVLSAILAVVTTVVSIPGRMETSRLLGLRDFGFGEYVLIALSAFLAFLVLLSITKLVLFAFKAAKGTKNP